MAFLHSHSCECMSSELDLFTIPPTQTSIESSGFQQYKPVSSLSDDSDAPIEFVVPAGSDSYFDLSHTLLFVQAKIIQTNTAAAENNKVGPVNNFLHSLFNQVDVFLNQKLVSPPNNLYAYRAYVENLLNYSPETKKTLLSSMLWYDETEGQLDASPNSGLNAGLRERQALMTPGRTVDMIGHIHCDLFNQDKMLLNGVEMRVRLVRSKDAFCLMDFTDDNKYAVKIIEASLLVRKAKISPGVLLAHANALSKTTAKYPITRVEIKSFTLHTGVLSESIPNAFLGQIPKRVLIFFVDNRAFTGGRRFNPFNFQHFSINYLSLYVDGQQVPSRPLQPRFTGNNPLYVEAFHTLASGTGMHFLNESNGINRSNYSKGFFITAFDLTPDLSAHCASHWNLVKSGNVSIEVRFEQALAQTVNCLVYAEYDNVLEIDSSRQVIADFSA